MNSAKPYPIVEGLSFVAFSNRSSLPFRDIYRIPEAETVMRGSVRHTGFPEYVNALVAIGLLNSDPQPWLKDGLTWAEITQHTTGAADASEE